MHITDLHVNAFGVCRELEFQRLAANVTVIYGPNEAGKTTLMQFVRGVLYGYRTGRTRYLGIHQGAEHGGWLTLSDGEEESGQVSRLAQQGARGLWSEEVRVAGTAKDLAGQEWLDARLAGVDEDIFNNVFTVGLQELQELGSLDATAAAEHLYDLTTGLDRVSLAEVMQFLEDEKAALIENRSGDAEIPLLCKRRQQLGGELDALIRKGRNWGRLAARKRGVQEDLSVLEQDLERFRTQQRLYEIALQIYPQWSERQQAALQLEQLGPQVSSAAAGLPAGATGQLDEFNEGIRSVRERIETIREQRRELSGQVESQPLSRRLLRQAARIEAVREHGHWVASLATQSQALESEVARLQQDVERQCPGASMLVAEGGHGIPELTPRTLNVLRAPARTLREEKRRCSEAEAELAQSRRDAEEACRELQLSMTTQGVDGLHQAITAAAETVSRLRRRMTTEEQLDRLARNRQDALLQGQELLEQELLPVWSLIGLGGVFVGGFIFLFTGLLLGSYFSLSGITGIVFSILGLGGMAAALGIKHAWEKNQARRQVGCRQQQELLALQEEQAKRDRDQLDIELAGGSGAWDYRAKLAEERLAELEALVPLDAARLTAERRCEATIARIEHLQGSRDAALHRWEEALQGLGLPSGLTPQQIRRLAEDARYISESQMQLRQRTMDLERCRKETADLENRVDQLFFDAGLTANSDDLQMKVRQLYSSLQQEREIQSQRRQCRRKDRQLKRKGRGLVDSLQEFQRKKRALLGQGGVLDEDEFREIASQRDFVLELKGRLEELDRQIQTQTVNRCDRTELASVLSEYDQPALNGAWDEVQDQLERRTRDGSRLNVKLGELSEQLRVSSEDREITETRFELGCVEQELAKKMERWQTVAITGHVLEGVRDAYERERQPETLQDASRYLKQMTDGRYRRVWTPLDENVLKVDDEAGNVLMLEDLSRGTREAVFICLRLALVQGYARRGISLPLVLDDVLVNCDAQRAAKAVEVLCEFAETGHQILFFTCHQHICGMFEEAEVEIRTLPDTGPEAALIAEASGLVPVEDDSNEDLVEVAEAETEEEDELEEEEFEEEAELDDEDELEEDEEEEGELEEEEAELDDEDELEEEEDEPEGQENVAA